MSDKCVESAKGLTLCECHYLGHGDCVDGCYHLCFYYTTHFVVSCHLFKGVNGLTAS